MIDFCLTFSLVAMACWLTWACVVLYKRSFPKCSHNFEYGEWKDAYIFHSRDTFKAGEARLCQCSKCGKTLKEIR